MANKFSPLRHPLAFLSTLLTDWRPLADDSVAISAANAEQRWQDLAAITSPVARDMLATHTQRVIEETRDRIKRSEDRRDKLTTLTAAVLAAVLSGFRFFAREPSWLAIAAACCFALALVILALSRRAIRQCVLTPPVTVAEAATKLDDEWAAAWHAVTTQRVIDGVNVMLDAWAAHADAAIALLSVGLLLLIPAIACT